MTTSCWHGSAATFVGPAYTVAWQCAGSFLCKASKPSPFSGSGLFYFGDILCHLNRPGHFEISSVFPNVSAPDSVIRNREHFWARSPPENIFTFPFELNHRFQQKKSAGGTKSFICPQSEVLKVSLRSRCEFWIFFPSPTRGIWRVQFSLLLPMFTSYKLHQKTGEPNSAENWTRFWRTDAIRPQASI